MPLIPISQTVTEKKFTDGPKFGKVVDNNDPLMIGRVKVEITGIFEGRVETLPWVRRKMDTLFCGADCEVFDVPEIGSIVEVRWSYDDKTPIYTGTPYNKKHQTGAFTNNYPNESGFKFGPHLIKFDKASELLTITNSKCTITLDALSGCTLDCKELDINVERNININCQNLNVSGDLEVEGNINSSKGANGTISMMTAAVVAGGIVRSVEG